MAYREMVKIDEDKCDGCGLCVPACAEGAIQIINGKAKLVADNLCDGLGACLGDCPQGAITIEKREADEFDEVAVEQHLKEIGREETVRQHPASPAGGCPSAQVKSFTPPTGGCPSAKLMNFSKQEAADADQAGQRPSELCQWPVLLNLVPPTAPFLEGKELLLAADCGPFAYADFHKDILKGRSVVVGCPKFDDTQLYIEKLSAMIKAGGISKIVVAHMEVPCCSGLIAIAKQAIEKSGIDMPLEMIKIGIQGDLK
ncbi:4Fe-4S binding domain-containing protein [Malonomonas rubra DSM 5091]|uniref:4Fe-4S binding domain-containing protein n=1 Tax=Malonomonas rubra DSM 5091 TaxID=1122189 RepID=A0A1M6KB22_MALRU|nr:4Fe-4S binding protein [Malonomonas rubra]SHJ56133.1 4Fe-4S binding domain-containing protein [Malonomonas rubra DSM 5091]